jgi:hypothetical protein
LRSHSALARCLPASPSAAWPGSAISGSAAASQQVQTFISLIMSLSSMHAMSAISRGLRQNFAASG